MPVPSGGRGPLGARRTKMRDKAQRDKPWIFRTYAGHSTARDSNALYRKNLAKGQTGLSVAFDLPTQTGYDSDHVLAQGRGRQGRRAGRPSRRHARAVRPDPARLDEHLDDHQRHRGVADGALHRGRRRAGRAAHGADRHDPERHHQGVSLARHLCVSAGALHAADQGRGDLHHDRIAEMESDEHLLLPSAGSGSDAGAGAGLCARHRDRGARHGEEIRRGHAGKVRRGGRPHLVLRQRGSALRHRNVQDARVHRTVGRDHPRALRHHRSQAAAVPLWRAGELARPHRAAAREQRHAHHDRDAGGDAVEERARPRRAASGLERGARPAAAVGPAMVAADAADPRLRDRPARIRRPVRRLARDRAQGRRAQARGQGRAQAHRARWAARSPRSKAAT